MLKSLLFLLNTVVANVDCRHKIRPILCCIQNPIQSSNRLSNHSSLGQRHSNLIIASEDKKTYITPNTLGNCNIDAQSIVES